MNDLHKIIRNVETLNASLGADYANLIRRIRSDKRATILKKVAFCIEELRQLQVHFAMGERPDS